MFVIQYKKKSNCLQNTDKKDIHFSVDLYGNKANEGRETEAWTNTFDKWWPYTIFYVI